MNIHNILGGGVAIVFIFAITMFAGSYSTVFYFSSSSENQMATVTGAVVASTTQASSTTKLITQPKPLPIKKPAPLPPVIIRDKMPTGMKWGVYTGWHAESMTDFEELTGKKPQMEMVFVHWGNESTFPSYYGSRIRDQGRTMVLFWEASDYKRDAFSQPEFSYDAVIEGKLDEYFRVFARGAEAYAGEIILIPYSEFNGNWYPWAGTKGSNTPEKHIKAFRHIRGFFKDVPNVKFAWVPNANPVPDVPLNKLELYYPGDAYVDYVGVDGFNFGGDQNQTFAELFGDTLTKLKKYKKPIYIFSFATAEAPDKADWIKNAMGVELYNHPEIKGWLWFHQDKERDWRVDSDKKALKTFIDILP